MSVSLDDVLITAELARRPSRRPDYDAENRALTALAEATGNSSQSILHKLAQAAMDLCDAGSAGVSILEPDGVLRWYAVAGQFASYVGRQIPRKASPCGTVLDANTSLLFTYPERHFDYGGSLHCPVVEAMVVPFVAGEKPIGTLWVVAHTPSRQFDIEDQRVLTSLSRFACAAYQMKIAVLTSEAARSAAADAVRQTLDAAATGLARCSRDLRYVSVNPAYEALAKLPAEQIVGRPIIDVMGAKAFEVIRPHVERVLRGERVEFEEEVPCAASGPKFLHVVHTPWINAAGHVDGWVASISDITNLRRATLGLQEREQRLRLALEASRGGSWTWDAPTGRVDWDDRFRELYGFAPEEPPSAGAWPRRVHEEDRPRVIGLLEEILRSKTRNGWDNTFRVVRPDGSVLWIESLGHAERDAEGRVIRLTGLDLDVTERRRAEETLRENEEREAFLLRLADTLRPLSDPLAMQKATARLLGEHLHANRVNYADIEGTDFIVRLSYANGVAPFVGRGPVATFGASLLDAHRPGEPMVVNDVRTEPRLTETERQILLGMEIAAFAGVMLVKDEQWVAAFGVHNATPRVWKKREIQLVRDVAERVWEAVERARAEEALREREQRLTLALDASAAGVWSWDPFTNQTTWDNRVREQYGFTAGTPQTFGSWISTVHEEDRPKVLSHLDDVVHGGQDEWNIMFRVIRADGTIVWMHALGRAERDPNGKVTRMSGISLNITERRRVEEALQKLRDEERDRTLQLLLETAAQGILSMDARGVIVTANRTLETMFGWGAGELTGMSVEVLLPTALRERHSLHRAAYFEAPQPRLMGGDLDLVGQRKDGSTFPIEISLNHVRTLTGEHAIALVTDITERKQAEEALRQSHAALEERTAELEKRTAQLSRLASELTLAEQSTREQLAKTLHDGLQQLLFVSKLGLDRVLEKEALQGNGLSSLLAEIRANIDDAISASRSLSMELFPPALHVAGLPAAVKWLSNWMQEKYGLTVLAVVDPRADSDQKDVRTLVFESLRELLFNAVKHAKVDRVAVDLAIGSNDTLCVTVEDQGIGFDPTALFHAVGSRKAGLGLFSIRERLMLLSGQLEIDSTPHRGTRFRIVVPRSTAHGPADVSRPAVHVANDLGSAVGGSASRQLRILIVDDHVGVRASLCRTLRGQPEFQVVGEAADGLEAIDQARNLRPDAIVMDISMPRMDGVEATRRIHAEFPFIQIFGLSSAERTGIPHPIEDAGGTGYFVKGTDMHSLIARLLSLPTANSAVGGHAN